MSDPIDPDTFSRIGKLFVDRDGEAPDLSHKRRQQEQITLTCGPDVADSRGLQLAVLTAANIANRCFPGQVRIKCDVSLEKAVLRIGKLATNFRSHLVELLAYDPIVPGRTRSEVTYNNVIFGNAKEKTGLRVTFDGWSVRVGPTSLVPRLPERDHCPIAAVAAGAFAVSELFMAFADVNIAACTRPVSFSLWRPNVAPEHTDALGPSLEFLPSGLWVLGLGHLGQAFLWALAALPYTDATSVELYLQDFDKVIEANIETGLLLTHNNITDFKTRCCSTWLEKRGFRTRLIERAFDGNFRSVLSEPKMAFCGFDNIPGRRALGTSNLNHIIECGLGATSDNFDVFNIHSLSHSPDALDLWPDQPTNSDASSTKTNPIYKELGDECGRVILADKAVAAPFVGAIAGCFSVAEVLRLLHGGDSYSQFKLRLSNPVPGCTIALKNANSIIDVGSIRYTPAMASNN